MRVFMCEFVTGGGMRDEAIPPSLASEGRMMRDALARDLAELPGVSLISSHDDRMPPAKGAASVPVTAGRDPWRLWAFCASHCDVVWPIAPESGGMLERLVGVCSDAGAIVVGPSREAIEIAASKRRTAERLIACGVPAAPAWRADAAPAEERGPFVLKPDDGAGCDQTRLAHPPLPADLPAGFTAQRFIPGDAASLCVLSLAGRATLLSANRQHVAIEDGAFRFRGVAVGALTDDGRLAALAQSVADALPGLDGIFGIDIVLGADGPVVIEVNPRLTTAYAGLRNALGLNPATLVAPFAIAPPPPISATPIEIRL